MEFEPSISNQEFGMACCFWRWSHLPFLGSTCWISVQCRRGLCLSSNSSTVWFCVSSSGLPPFLRVFTHIFSNMWFLYNTILTSQLGMMISTWLWWRLGDGMIEASSIWMTPDRWWQRSPRSSRRAFVGPCGNHGWSCFLTPAKMAELCTHLFFLM